MAAPQLMRDIGCEVIELYSDIDGTFPNHHPDPSVADNLVQLQQWQRYKGFISLLPIAVIDRPSYSYQAMSAGRQLFKRRYTSAQLRHRLRESRVDLPGWCFIAGQRHHASATAIRKGRTASHASMDDI